MKRTLFPSFVCLAILFSSGLSYAKDDQWRWYYTSFLSNVNNKVFTRHGNAELTISEGGVSGFLVESSNPAIQIPLSDTILADQVTMVLPTFFPSHAIEFSGKIREEIYEECKYEEIRLQYELPNGETMVISRTTGDCIE